MSKTLYIGRPRRAANLERPYGLLLRGGGHGAFAAGFIDELLAAGIRFDAISAAGAGVANAVVLAFGLAQGGPGAGRKALQAFWRQVGAQKEWPTEAAEPARTEMALRRIVDFDSLRADDGVAVFIATTNALIGRPRLFSKREIDLGTVLAAMAPLSSARTIERTAYCAAGMHEELAVLPLTGDHRPGEIVAPFFAPALQARAERSTTEDLWAMGRSSARTWTAAHAYRLYRARPAPDAATSLAA